MQELSIIFSSPQNHMSTSAKTGSRLFHKKHSKKTGFIVWQLVCCTQPHYLKKAACQTKEGVLTVSIFQPASSNKSPKLVLQSSPGTGATIALQKE